MIKRYAAGVLLPAICQAIVVYGVMVANQGSGSFVGLGAYLLGLAAIPLTAIINTWYVKTHPQLSMSPLFVHCLVVALMTPALLLLINMLSSLAA